MATTMFYEGTLKDKGEQADTDIALEFGSSTAYGEPTMYFVIDGRTVILSESGGREICEALARLVSYLGYDK